MFTERSVEPYTGDGVDRTLTVGKEGSLHSKDPETNQSIPGAQLTEEADMLGMANLGVGIANLAVGAYNAYQIHQTQDEVRQRARETQRTVRREGQKTRGEIRDVKRALAQGFSEVQRVLEYQNGLLHTIEEVQQSHGRKLDAIMQGLLEGFESVEEHIRSVTRKRRNDTYLEKLNALHIAKEDIAEALKYDEPSETELQKLESRAEDLRSWVEARLQQSDLHLLGRQPLVFAEVEARVSRIDAQMFRDPDRYQKRVPERFDDMRSKVRREVERLHDDASPWEIATILRDYVRNYGTLHRSLARSRDLIDGTETYERHVATLSDSDGQPPSDDDGEMLAEEGYFISPWSNPLPTPPESESNDTLDTPVELTTLDDYEWLVRAFDLDRSDFDVHEVTSLPAEVLAERLGTDEVFGDLSTLQALAMPDTWSRYRRAVEEEFDLRPDVCLNDVELGSEGAGTQKGSSQQEISRALLDPFRYSEVLKVFPRQKHNTELLIGFRYGEDYRIHLDINDENVHVTLFKGGQLAGKTQTTLDQGGIEFEIHNSIDDERMSFKLVNKTSRIKVDGSFGPRFKIYQA